PGADAPGARARPGQRVRGLPSDALARADHDEAAPVEAHQRGIVGYGAAIECRHPARVRALRDAVKRLELRRNVASYDAWYVAVAERFALPLGPLDRRLSRVSGPSGRFLVPR